MADDVKEDVKAPEKDKPAGKTAGKIGTFVEKHKKAVYILAGLFVLVVVYFLVRGNTSTSPSTASTANQNPTGVSPIDTSGLGATAGGSPQPVDTSNSGPSGSPGLGSFPDSGSSFVDTGGNIPTGAPATAPVTSSPVRAPSSNTGAVISPWSQIANASIIAGNAAAATAPIAARPKAPPPVSPYIAIGNAASQAAIGAQTLAAARMAPPPPPPPANPWLGIGNAAQSAAIAAQAIANSRQAAPPAYTPPPTSTYAPGGMRRK